MSAMLNEADFNLIQSFNQWFELHKTTVNNVFLANPVLINEFGNSKELALEIFMELENNNQNKEISPRSPDWENSEIAFLCRD